MNNKLDNNVNERITINDFVTFVLLWIKRYLKKWKTITLFVVIGVLIGFLVYYLSPTKYVAETNFVVSDGDNSVSPLEQFGLSTSESVGLFEGDNLVWLYTTNAMIQGALKTRVYNGKDSVILLDWLTKFDSKINDRKKELGIKNLGDKLQEQNNRSFQSLLNSASNRIKENYLEVGYIKKTEQVIFVKVTSPDEAFSIAFNEILVQKVNEYYVRTKSQKERTQVEILTEKLQEVERSTLKSISKAARETDNVPYANPMKSVLFDNAEKSKLDLQSTSSVYIQLSQKLEAAKIQLEQVTPLIQIIETPAFPLKIERPNKILTSAIGGILFFLLAIIIIYLRSLKITFPKEN